MNLLVNSVVSVIDRSKLQDSLVEKIEKGTVPKELVFDKLTTYEEQNKKLQSLLHEKERLIVQTNSNLAKTQENNKKLSDEIRELNTFVSKIEETHRFSCQLHV